MTSEHYAFQTESELNRAGAVVIGLSMLAMILAVVGIVVTAIN